MTKHNIPSLLKPFRVRELTELVRQQIQGRTGLTKHGESDYPP